MRVSHSAGEQQQPLLRAALLRAVHVCRGCTALGARGRLRTLRSGLMAGCLRVGGAGKVYTLTAGSSEPRFGKIKDRLQAGSTNRARRPLPSAREKVRHLRFV